MRVLLPFIALTCCVSSALANVDRTRDSTGTTLQQIKQKHYSQYLTTKGNITSCSYLTLKGKVFRHYQLHQMQLRSYPSSFLTDADRLNGIDFKASTSVKSKSYRERLPNSNKWSEWKPGTPAFMVYIQSSIERRNGKFKLIPSLHSHLIKKQPNRTGKRPRTLRDLAS